MLWKKESMRPDALYVDVFQPNTRHWDSVIASLLQENIDQKPHPKKSDTIALQKRNQGNERFRKHEYLDAIELYGDSLRFAQPKSEHISLAYANRAACFLNLKLYEKCLKDIELAKEAGYPEHLMTKLDQRKNNCLKEMHEDPKTQRELTIEPNDRFPCMANLAKVQKSKKGEYTVLAEKDIDVGQTIVLENAFQAQISDRFGTKCNICVKEYGNLIPCDKCAVAMFCSECDGHFLHEYECGLNFCGGSTFNSLTLGSVRDVLLILKEFSNNVDELMSFVEHIRTKPNELPNDLLDIRSKYWLLLLSNPLQSWYKSTDDIAKVAYPAYRTILTIPKMKEVFASMKHRRFLMHLIGQLALIPDCASGFPGNLFPDYEEPSVRIRIATQRYFKHSCDPNVLNFIRDGKSVWFAIKPIKKGEQLYISYAPIEMNSKQERLEYLWEQLRIRCMCRRCNGKTASPTQRQQLISDPAYRYIQLNRQYFSMMQIKVDKLKPFMENCKMVLQKYGRMDWCDEIGDVIEYFQALHFHCNAGQFDIDHPLACEILSKCTLQFS